jgi:hypothetical protein
MTPEQYVDAVYGYAAEQMRNGVAPAAIEQDLIARGLDAESASTVVQNLKQAKAKVLKEAGQKNMLFGALWCIGGTAVTVLSFASAKPGGSYVLAWGAIIFGAVQFFRGLSQMSGE